ncbi:hypothetical protein TNCV_215011 [Trichonephila clavipes]|nr:hypothetical protein TNCV_215011 [Trichonephila clavipes]
MGETIRKKRNPIICYYCNEVGHIKPACPKLMKTDFETGASLRVNSEDEDCFEKFKVKFEINGVERQCLRDTESTIDLCASSWIDENDYLGEYVLIKSPLDVVCHRLPLAKVTFKTKGGEFYTKAAVKVNSHPSEPYLLSNRTAKLIQSREKCAHDRRNVFPTQGDGADPTIEFPAFDEKNERDTAQLKNYDFSSEQNKCKDQHVLRERTKWGVSECCRKKEGNLERVGTKGEAAVTEPITSPQLLRTTRLAAKVAEIPVCSLIPGKEVRNLVLGVTRDASTMCFVSSRSGDGSAS